MKQINDKSLTYQEAFRIRKRMCKILGADCCRDCPLDIENNGKGTNCDTFMEAYTDLAESILKKWAAKHPIKTNRDKFIEVFGYPTHISEECKCKCNIAFDGEDKTMCLDCDWWDKEYVKPEETDDE